MTMRITDRDQNSNSLRTLAGRGLPDQDAGPSPRALWTNLVLCCLCLFFTSLSYFPIAGVYTTINAEIGYVTFGVMWLAMAVGSLFLAPSAVSSFGSKLSVIFGTCLYLAFVSLNYYQSWPTLVMAGAASGLGSSFVWTGLLCTVNYSAASLAHQRKGSSEKYISMANGFLYLSYFASAVFGGAVSSAILLPGQVQRLGHLEPRNAAHVQGRNISFSLTRLANGLSSFNDTSSCLDLATDTFNVPAWSYYSLLSTAFLGTAIGTALSLGIRETPVFKCKCCVLCKSHLFCSSIPKTGQVICKQLDHFAGSHLKPIAKSLTRPKNWMVVPVVYLAGINHSYILGTFSRHFISECLGVGVVGLAVIALAFSSSLSTLFIGKVSPYISRTLIAIPAALLQAGMILFMLFWQREPSYVMVFLTCIGWGVMDAAWQTIATTYVGIVADIKERKAIFGLLKGFLALGGATNSIASGYISIEANLWSILVMLIISSVLYIIGEKVFTPTSRPVNCINNMNCNSSLTSESVYVTNECEHKKSSAALRATNPLALYMEEQHHKFSPEDCQGTQC